MLQNSITKNSKNEPLLSDHETWSKDAKTLSKDYPFSALPFYKDESGKIISGTGSILRSLGIKFGFIAVSWEDCANVETIDGVLCECFDIIKEIFKWLVVICTCLFKSR